MINLHSEQGQALVELALVMPMLVLFWIVVLSLLFLIRTKIFLDQSAMHVASAAALGKNVNLSYALETVRLKEDNVMRGMLLPPTVQSRPTTSWKRYAFPAIDTLSDHGQIAGVTLRYLALPASEVSGLLPVLNLHAYSEMLDDPSLAEVKRDE